jgi:hypothetical protein
MNKGEESVMFTNDLTRRKILSGAMQISVGGAVLLTVSACGDSSKVALCVDPDKLSSGEKSLRASLHYNAKSPDATKDCKGCSFWKATPEKAECGHCDILTGITEGSGHCDSWSARATG